MRSPARGTVRTGLGRLRNVSVASSRFQFGRNRAPEILEEILYLFAVRAKCQHGKAKRVAAFHLGFRQVYPSEGVDPFQDPLVECGDLGGCLAGLPNAKDSDG